MTLLSSIAFAQESKLEEKIYTQLLSYDFEKTDSLITLVKTSDKRMGFSLLRQILYHSGNNKVADSISRAKLEASIGESENDLKSLIDSYFHLFYSRRSEKMLTYMDSAYVRLKPTKNKQAFKLSLIPFLYFYSTENTYKENHFNKYLQEYIKIQDDLVDRCWIVYYTNLREGKTINGDTIIFKKSGKENLHLYLNYSSKLSYALQSGLASNIGINYRINGEKDLSINYFQKVLNLPDLPYLQENKFFASLDLGRIYMKSNRHKLSLEHYNNAESYINQADSKRQLVTYSKHKAHYYYRAMDTINLAYDLLNKAFNDNRRINYEENSSRITELDVKFDAAQKDKRILKQENDLLLKEKQSTQNRNIALGLGAGLAAVSILGFLVYKNTRRKQRIAEQEKELEIQKKEKILKEQELSAIDSMIAGQEKERQRLASDLHDSVGATLSAAKLQFDHLSKNRGQLEEFEELFDKTASLLDEAYTEVRSMAHLKNSGVIASKGLLPAVEKLAKNASSTHGLTVEVQDFGLTEKLEGSLEISIFRIIQELVSNIIKHADASEAHISITQHEDTLNIIVEDNGKGFNPKKAKKKEGMGLHGIEKRVEHLEGSLEVDSTPGRGTNILIDIPI